HRGGDADVAEVVVLAQDQPGRVGGPQRRHDFRVHGVDRALLELAQQRGEPVPEAAVEGGVLEEGALGELRGRGLEVRRHGLEVLPGEVRELRQARAEQLRAPERGVGSLSTSYPSTAGWAPKRAASIAHIATYRVRMPTPSAAGASAQNASRASCTAGEERYASDHSAVSSKGCRVSVAQAGAPSPNSWENRSWWPSRITARPAA